MYKKKYTPFNCYSGAANSSVLFCILRHGMYVSMHAFRNPPWVRGCTAWKERHVWPSFLTRYILKPLSRGFLPLFMTATRHTATYLMFARAVEHSSNIYTSFSALLTHATSLQVMLPRYLHGLSTHATSLQVMLPRYLSLDSSYLSPSHATSVSLDSSSLSPSHGTSCCFLHTLRAKMCLVELFNCELVWHIGLRMYIEWG